MVSVLVVDDDPIQLEVSTALLKSVGAAQIKCASSGAAARTELAENVNFDLLLLDLNMPDYDGVEILGHLRQISFRGEIIINSAAAEGVRNRAGQLAAAYGLRIAAVLEKPTTLPKLVSALTHAQL